MLIRNASASGLLLNCLRSRLPAVSMKSTIQASRTSPFGPVHFRLRTDAMTSSRRGQRALECLASASLCSYHRQLLRFPKLPIVYPYFTRMIVAARSTAQMATPAELVRVLGGVDV